MGNRNAQEAILLDNLTEKRNKKMTKVVREFLGIDSVKLPSPSQWWKEANQIDTYDDGWVFFYPFNLAGLPARYYKMDGTLIDVMPDMEVLRQESTTPGVKYKMHRFGLVVFVNKSTMLVTKFFLVDPEEQSTYNANPLRPNEI